MQPTSLNDELVVQAHAAAEHIIGKNITPVGLAASIEGYRHVWARDSMITFLGAAIARNGTVMESFRQSLDTLAEYQDRFGQIPYLVDIATRKALFGSVDSNSWFVIGAAHYIALSGDAQWGANNRDRLAKALDWCEAMDLAHTGLMMSPECFDWADLMANHGNVLFPNVLCSHALRAGAQVLESIAPAEAARFRGRRETVRHALQEYFWVKAPGECIDDTHGRVRAKMSILLRKRPYFLPWVGLFDYGDYLDTTGNMLAVLCGVATAAQASQILDYIDSAGVNRPFPVRVLHPPIRPGEQNWREYHRINNLNMPHQYHNGGIWPWVGGLYVAALVKAGRPERAREELALLAAALKRGSEPWECNEWLHGETGRPMGVRFQAWSAGMFLYAHHAVETGELPGLTA